MPDYAKIGRQNRPFGGSAAIRAIHARYWGLGNEFNVVIAGGGVIGSACAYYLHSHPHFRGSIAVVEPDPTYTYAASARSASSVRQQFSTPVNIALSAFGLDFLRQAPRDATGLVVSTYLYLATAAGRSSLEERSAIQRAAQVPVTLRDRAQLAQHYPWLETSDLVAGTDTAGVEGWFDGYGLLRLLRGANERNGVTYLRDTVIGFEQSPDRRIVAALLKQRGRTSCDSAVIATGTRSRELAAGVGVDLPVFARKRTVFVFSCPTALPRCPLVIDPSGLWFRPEGDRFLCGVPADPDPDVSPDDFAVDHGLFENLAWPTLAHRVPAFEAVRVTSAWSGHYDYNVFDQNAFVGPVPGIENLLLASGFSGHGLQHAPGIGRGLAEYILFGESRSIDLRPLSYARYLAGEPLRELNVI
jgi:glycine/D-amino acid oxidase-like deaminating enzyme